MNQIKFWQGRYFIRDKEEKRNKPLARYKMEKYLGKKLKTDEIVHHKNGLKTDDRLCNLEIQERGKHTQYHLKKFTIAELKQRRVLQHKRSYYKNIEKRKAYEMSKKGRARAKKWREKHKDKIKRNWQIYYKKNKEKLIEKQRIRRKNARC